MSCGEPPDIDLREFAARHVRNDVRWFARAVANYELAFGRTTELPDSIVAFLDSALLHGRALIEFLGHADMSRNPRDVRACHYLLTSWPCDGRQSSELRGWKLAADRKLAHLTARRDPEPLSDSIVRQVVTNGSDSQNRWRLPDLWTQIAIGLSALAEKSTAVANRAAFAAVLEEADSILGEAGVQRTR